MDREDLDGLGVVERSHDEGELQREEGEEGDGDGDGR